MHYQDSRFPLDVVHAACNACDAVDQPLNDDGNCATCQAQQEAEAIFAQTGEVVSSADVAARVQEILASHE